MRLPLRQRFCFAVLYSLVCAFSRLPPRAQIKHSFKNHKLGVVSVSAAKDGLSCVSSSIDGDLHMFDLTSHSLKSTIAAGPVETWQVAVHPTRSQICATGSHSGHVNVWVCRHVWSMLTMNYACSAFSNHFVLFRRAEL